VVDWAQEEDALLLADEIFHDLRFEKKPPPSLLETAGPERTVAVGSVSKSFMCGLRIGWLVSSAERVRSLVTLKRSMDLGCPPLMEGIALSLLESGAYDAHTARARAVYKARRDATLEALEQYMPEGVTWTRPEGGFHMWVELPKGYSSIALFLLAVERGVAIVPGPHHDVDHRFMNAFPLRYGMLKEEEIHEGVALLADAMKTLLKEPPGDSGLSGLGNYL
jgi:2-aminoadipate transaminase